MADTNSPCPSEIERLPIEIGASVRGFRFEYKVLSELGKGGRGHAFLVEATGGGTDSNPLPTGKCVLKTVRVDERRSVDEVFSFAGHVHELLVREFRALRRLRKVPCVPEVYDFGQVGFTLKARSQHDTDETVPLTFIVRAHVDGNQLDKFLLDRFGTVAAGADKKTFSGICDPHEWFKLGRALATALLQIQQREVVHRDIWHENILVDHDNIRFIDFGDAYFRQEVATQRSNERSDPFVAPEIRMGSRWPSRRADIYSMGGVLLYMATGEPPPLPIENDDELKRKVIASILGRNPDLYRANHGVADVIARCLRSRHHKRIMDAEMLLGELRVFDVGFERPTLRVAFDQLTNQLGAGEDGRLPGLFNEIAAVELNHLSNVIEGMQLGSVDINGDHERIASGLTHYLSVLDRGDEYLAVSTAEFWAPDNAGTNGRVLSMNRVLAQRGVVIRRLFLVTQDELDDSSSLFYKVAAEHLSKYHDIAQSVKWDTFVKVVDPANKADAIDFFWHYGVWIKKEQAVKILPVYSRHGQDARTLRALRIRKYDGDVRFVREEFDEMVRDARRLSEVVPPTGAIQGS